MDTEARLAELFDKRFPALPACCFACCPFLFIIFLSGFLAFPFWFWGLDFSDWDYAVICRCYSCVILLPQLCMELTPPFFYFLLLRRVLIMATRSSVSGGKTKNKKTKRGGG